MGRIRTIKPDFFKHSGLFDAEIEEKLPLRLAYAGLWTCCDREGRFSWKPRELKLDILPYDNCDFSRVLDALSTRGWIVKYASDGRVFGYIPTWKRHQVINNRESDSVLPDPLKNEILTDASSTREARVDHAPLGEGKGREGKGRSREARVEEVPAWIPEESWDAFVEMRKKIKKPLTEFAKKLSIKKLESLRKAGYEPSVILDAAVMNNWQGLFIPKGPDGQPVKPSRRKYRAGDPNNPADWAAATLPLEVLE